MPAGIQQPKKEQTNKIFPTFPELDLLEDTGDNLSKNDHFKEIESILKTPSLQLYVCVYIYITHKMYGNINTICYIWNMYYIHGIYVIYMDIYYIYGIYVIYVEYI